MKIETNLVPYHSRLEARDPSTLTLIVIHCTEVPTLHETREFGERIQFPETQTGASGHFYIDRDGSLHRYVEESRKARHVVGFNDFSLGIELVNTGRYPHWFHSAHQEMSEPYSVQQIASLKELLKDLKTRFPGLAEIARHSDLDKRTIAAEDDPTVEVRRRIDPGPMFPWLDITEFWKTLQR